MRGEFVERYKNELEYVRKKLKEFRDLHPEVSEALEIEEGGSTRDPHVELIIQALAFLNARTQLRLDDDFPELTRSVLSTICPNHLSPIPSMAVAQFSIDRNAGGRTIAFKIPRSTAVEVADVKSRPCQYRTTCDLDLWPFAIESATLGVPGPGWIEDPDVLDTQSKLDITLRCFLSDATFAKMSPTSLRFFINPEQRRSFAFDLHRAVLNHTIAVYLSDGDRAKVRRKLDLAQLRQVGFERNESILPDEPHYFHGYRLLSEYFAFPEKFLFFEIVGLEPSHWAEMGSRVTLSFALEKSFESLQRHVQKSSLVVGAVPVVSLFSHTANSIVDTGKKHRYPVTPDARYGDHIEIYRIENVTAITDDGLMRQYQPFFSFGNDRRAVQNKAFWHATREPRLDLDSVDEHFVTFVDLDFQPDRAVRQRVTVSTTAHNIIDNESFKGVALEAKMLDGAAKQLVESVFLIVSPKKTLRTSSGRSANWKLISHLVTNHLPFGDEGGSPEVMKEILSLYDLANNGRPLINALKKITARRGTARISLDGETGFVRGNDIEVLMDDREISEYGVYLFGCILDRFFGFYSGPNSFTRLEVRLDRPNTGEKTELLHRWPPRAGKLRLI